MRRLHRCRRGKNGESADLATSRGCLYLSSFVYYGDMRCWVSCGVWSGIRKRWPSRKCFHSLISCGLGWMSCLYTHGISWLILVLLVYVSSRTAVFFHHNHVHDETKQQCSALQGQVNSRHLLLDEPQSQHCTPTPLISEMMYPASRRTMRNGSVLLCLYTP